MGGDAKEISDVGAARRTGAVGEEQARRDLLPGAGRGVERLPGQVRAAPAEPARRRPRGGRPRAGERAAGHRRAGRKQHDAFDVRIRRQRVACAARGGQRLRLQQRRLFAVERFDGLFRRLLDRHALSTPRVGIVAAQRGLRPVLPCARGRRERRLDATSCAALLTQVVQQHADDEHHAGDEQAQEQRIHHDAAAICLG